MPKNPFELVVLVPSSHTGLSTTGQLKSAASLSWTGPSGNIGAIFSDFPNIPTKSLEAIQQVAACPGVLVKLGARLLFRTAEFVRTLQCYLESLKENDKFTRCTGKAAEVGWHVECRNSTCFSTCRLLCIACLENKGSATSPIQLHELAVRGEVVWCPNFHSPW